MSPENTAVMECLEEDLPETFLEDETPYMTQGPYETAAEPIDFEEDLYNPEPLDEEPGETGSDSLETNYKLFMDNALPSLEKKMQLELGRIIMETGEVLSRGVLRTAYGADGVLNKLNTNGETLKAAESYISEMREYVSQIIGNGILECNKRKMIQELGDIQNETAELLLPLKPKHSLIANLFKELMEYRQRLENSHKGNGQLDIAKNIGDLPGHFIKSMDMLKDPYKIHQDARDILSRSNLRLVISIANKYKWKGLSFYELIGYGSLGLTRAFDYYDYRRGVKFSTYATWWIKQGIKGALTNDSRTISVSANAYETIFRIRKICNNMYSETGQRPRPEEIAELIGKPVKKVRLLMKRMKRPRSLEEAFPDDDRYCLGTSLKNPKSPNPVRQACSDESAKKIHKSLKSITKKQSLAIRLRYGIEAECLKVEEIGRALGIPWQAVSGRVKWGEKELRGRTRIEKLYNEM